MTAAAETWEQCGRCGQWLPHHHRCGHVNEKQCGRCGRWLPVNAFYRRAASPDGLQARCKTCSDERAAAWRTDRKARVDARNEAVRRLAAASTAELDAITERVLRERGLA